MSAEVLAVLRNYMDSRIEAGCSNAVHRNALESGQIVILDETIEVSSGIPWHDQNRTRLSQYVLHYMDSIRVLAEVCAENYHDKYKQTALSWMENWIEHNPIGSKVAWDPFPISVRLINWCLACSIFGDPGPRIRASMAEQTMYLLDNLEYDTRGNHLLKNAQALVVVGSVFTSDSDFGRTALSVGYKLLLDELREQVLEDGGHYERSLMYHCHVLEDILLTYVAMRKPPLQIVDSIERMAAFLADLTLGDQGIPLFGDAVRGDLSPQNLLCLCRLVAGVEVKRSSANDYGREASGFYVMTIPNHEAQLIAKAGDPGPCYQLGHAHCDFGSYEVSSGSQRIVVDSGVSEYESGPLRHYFRSSAAHNTVRVNDGEQLEFWGSFRVGRRYRVIKRTWRPENDLAILSACHDGFKPNLHTRTITKTSDAWLVYDEITGPGDLTSDSRIHFHPDIHIQRSGHQYRCEWDSGCIFITGIEWQKELQSPMSEISSGWYAEQFGIASTAPVIVFRSSGQRLLRFGYAIHFCSTQTFDETPGLNVLRKILASAP
jgi:uncharacterized heparinase superfamily protein